MAGAGIEQRPCSFVSQGVTLRGRLLLPATPRPAPAVVLTHGFAFVAKLFDAHDYPLELARAGFVTLTYDHPCTGASDGPPRQELDPVAQQRGYTDAITALSAMPEVDPDRIGIWGTSFSGGHVLAVAAADPRVRCVVSQVMTISGHANLIRRQTPQQYRETRRRWAQDRLGRLRGDAPLMSRAGSDATLRYLASLPDSLSTLYTPEVTARTYEWYDANEPAARIERISPRPLLMIVCSDDTTTPAEDSLAAYARALEPKQLLLLDGEHHDAYDRHFATTSGAAVSFFSEHLRAGCGPGSGGSAAAAERRPVPATG